MCVVWRLSVCVCGVWCGVEMEGSVYVCGVKSSVCVQNGVV